MYPGNKTEFALVYALTNMILGFTSSLGGGIISDKFGGTNARFKAQVCVASSLIAIPFYVASMLITNNFWLSMACTAARFLLGEPYRAPNVTMI